jgi:hypothetical protein
MDQSAAVPATHVPHLRTCGKPEVDAVLDHPDLRVFWRILVVQKQSVMNVVAPESAIDESQRIVVVPDLIGRDSHGGHQISKRAGEKAERS